MMTKQWVYGFGGGESAGDASMKALLGGKGANLAEMAKLGLPVPPGFTITTEVCTEFYENKRNYPAELAGQVRLVFQCVDDPTHGAQLRSVRVSLCLFVEPCHEKSSQSRD